MNSSTSSDDSDIDQGVYEDLVYLDDSGEEADESGSEADNSIGLAPYNFEPKKKISPEEIIAPDSNSEDTDTFAKHLRIGNVEWCSCKNCAIMTTWEESVCCREFSAIPSQVMDGKIY